MKRTIIILSAILIALYVTLSMLAGDGEYQAEKIFYKAMKTYSKIAQNPDVAPPAMLASAENDLKGLLKKYPDTLIAKSGWISLAELYVTGKRYDEAMSTLDDAIGKYKDDAMSMSVMLFMKGSVYEKSGQWDKALVEFKLLRDKYPNTQLGLQVPIYIVRYYVSKGDEVLSKEAYTEAVNYYKKIETDNSGKVLGYMASTLMLQSCVDLKDYEAAGATLEATLMKYPSPTSFNQLLPLVEKIYVEKLGSPERAIELYKKADALVKGGNMKKILEKRIAVLEKGKK